MVFFLGLPYFSSINKKIQYGVLGKECNITLNVVSNPKLEEISVYNNDSEEIEDVDYQIKSSKIKDIVYGKTVNIKGYKLFVPIITSVTEDFMIYSIIVTNAYGPCNISVDFRSASKYCTFFYTFNNSIVLQYGTGFLFFFLYIITLCFFFQHVYTLKYVQNNNEEEFISNSSYQAKHKTFHNCGH